MHPDDHSATGSVLSATGSFVPVPCPKCAGTLARRSHRDGLTEKMMSLMYVYPFRCQQCGHRFFSLQWGTRYRRIPVDHREYHRQLVQIPVMLFGRQGGVHGKTSDLSVTGCTLRASGQVWQDSRWRVQLLLPAETRPVMIDDAVVRAVRNQQIGMEFLQHAPGEKERIGRFIDLTLKQTVAGITDFNGRTSLPIPGPDVAGMATQPGQSLSP